MRKTRRGVAMLLLASLVLPACHSLDRLFRHSPLSGDADPDRVNLWPLYYANDGGTAVLWPIYDHDADGFALRPLITKDGTDWEFLPPVAWWDTESGHWFFIPAYSLRDNLGLFPVFGSGELNYVGPVWWTEADEEGSRNAGLMPLASFTADFNHVGPVWWSRDETGAIDSYGLFPLVDVGDGFNNFGPVFWGYDDDGEMDYLVGFPLFGYGEGDDGEGMLVTLLGGKGWNAEGETTFINVLGPVYHYDRDTDGESISVLWPIWNQFDGQHEASWSLFPLADHVTYYDDEGERTLSDNGALAGIVRTRHREGLEALRILGLASYRGAEGGGDQFADYLTLFGYHDRGEKGYRWHAGTPLVFDYEEHDGGYGWDALLSALHYETEEDRSEFSFLWYLYRQKTEGTETKRDFFPFVSWDTGVERSRFSLLWRLFNWERDGEKTGGHFLFIPWGDV